VVVPAKLHQLEFFAVAACFDAVALSQIGQVVIGWTGLKLKRDYSSSF